MIEWHLWKNVCNVLAAMLTTVETRLTGLPISCTFSHIIFLSLSTSSIALHQCFKKNAYVSNADFVITLLLWTIQTSY